MNNSINNNDIQYNINSNHKGKLNPIYKDNNNDYLNKINSKIDSEALVKNNNFLNEKDNNKSNDNINNLNGILMVEIIM